MFAIGTGSLSPDDLPDVLSAIHSIRRRWYYIGLMLRISYNELDVIKGENTYNATDCLTEMLKQWLTSTASPTWSSLVQALSSAPVGEKRLAQEIREKYCNQDGEQTTGPTQGAITTVDLLGVVGRKKRREEEDWRKGKCEREIVKRVTKS